MIHIKRPDQEELDEKLREIFSEKARDETSDAVRHYLNQLKAFPASILHAANALKEAVSENAADGPQSLGQAATDFTDNIQEVIGNVQGFQSLDDPKAVIHWFAGTVPLIKELKTQLKKYKKVAQKQDIDIEKVEKAADKLNIKLKAFGKFRVYKEDLLVAKLKELFFEKCAYCESSFAHVSPADIEHFRPKSAVQVAKDTKSEEARQFKPGYYWLAADWHNLLLSCIDCNRRRYQSTADEVEEVASGKSTIFPLSDEAFRVRDHETWNIREERQKEEEHRLLLNPCEDKPEDHLEFDLRYRSGTLPANDGPLEAVLAKARNNSPRGDTSIAVYGLNRTGLVLERKRAALDLQNDFFALVVATKGFLRMRKMEKGLGELKKNLANIPELGKKKDLLKLTDSLIEDASNAQEEALNDIGKALSTIRNKFKPGQPYLAMKRTIIEKDILTWPPMQEMREAGMFTEEHIQSLITADPLPSD